MRTAKEIVLSVKVQEHEDVCSRCRGQGSGGKDRPGLPHILQVLTVNSMLKSRSPPVSTGHLGETGIQSMPSAAPLDETTFLARPHTSGVRGWTDCGVVAARARSTRSGTQRACADMTLSNRRSVGIERVVRTFAFKFESPCYLREPAAVFCFRGERRGIPVIVDWEVMLVVSVLRSSGQ